MAMSEGRRRRVAGSVPLILLPLLCGCYEFDRPLGPPAQGTIDSALVGPWSCVASQEKEKKPAMPLAFLAFDDTQYVIVMTGDKGELGAFRGHSARVGSETLLSVQELKTAKDPAAAWAFVRYRLEPGPRLHIWLVDDKEVGASTGEKALDLVRKRVADEKIYAELLACTRPGDGR
jgi:hypothetical protein